MTHRNSSYGREKGARKPKKPLDPEKLEELALSYVARFATSSGKLSAYLARKLRERGWAGDNERDVDEGRDCAKGIVERFVSRGFVDDAGYARAKAGDLLRRGYGARRVGQALNAAGIDEEIRSRAAPGEGARRAAVLALARRRRFGPFARGGADDALSPEERRRAHEKRLAAMLRAGHNHGDAQAMLAFARVEEAEQWVSEGYEDADEDEKPQDDKWGQLP